MEYTAKDLIEKLNLTKMALSKSLKNIPFESKKLDTSAKPVKHYKYEDLPTRYKEKLIELGLEKEEVKDTNISKTNFKGFTKKYLLASAQKQEKAIKKVRFIEFYLKRDISVSQIKFIENTFNNSIEFDILGNVTPKMLNDWLVKYKEVKAKDENLVEAFVDGRGLDKKDKTALTIEMQEMAIRFFLKKSHPILTNIHFIMCGHFGSSMPSYDCLNKFYLRWKKANPQLVLFAKSPDKWKNSYMVALGNESEKAAHRNHYWELDATPADVICSDGKRYTILGLIDVFTRRVIFRVEDSNSSFAVSRLLRAGILSFGVPDVIVIDNGKEFTSNHFESICRNLNIDLLVAPPFSGDKKPHIERVFGSLARGLFREMRNFIGHNVAMKEELQARFSYEHKMNAIERFKQKHKEEEDAYRELWKIRKENVGIKLDFSLTKDKLQNVINMWVDNYYEQRKHSGLKGKSPISFWNSFTKPVQSIRDERMLDLLLGKSYEKTVNAKKGIQHEACAYWHDELEAFIGKKVKIMTTDDMGEILVYDFETMNIICKAYDYENSGNSREVAYKAKKKQKESKKLMQKAIKLAEEADDPTMLSTIEKMGDSREKAKTMAVPKHTTVTNMLLTQSYKLKEQDQLELETSNQYDFKNKDEDGKPKKVLEGGRPEFVTFVDRFLWCLEKNEWNEKDLKLKELKPESYEMAFKEFEKRKLA